MKILIIELKELVLLRQYKLHRKLTAPLYSVILKEKEHIRRVINSKKKEIFIWEISIIIIILIYQKFPSLGPVQQKIKLPSPYYYYLLFCACVSFFFFSPSSFSSWSTFQIYTIYIFIIFLSLLLFISLIISFKSPAVGGQFSKWIRERHGL